MKLISNPVEEKKIWTQHSKRKLKHYRFSEKRALRIFRKPDRVEEGIAPNTIAAMQITGTKKRPTEAWIMYVILKRPRAKKENSLLSPSPSLGRDIKIISVWRYPGRTPVGERPVIPQDALEELYRENE